MLRRTRNDYDLGPYFFAIPYVQPEQLWNVKKYVSCSWIIGGNSMTLSIMDSLHVCFLLTGHFIFVQNLVFFFFWFSFLLDLFLKLLPCSANLICISGKCVKMCMISKSSNLTQCFKIKFETFQFEICHRVSICLKML